MPASLVILSIIALVLYILFGYVLPPFLPASPAPSWHKSIVAVLVIMSVLLFWFLIPIHIGR